VIAASSAGPGGDPTVGGVETELRLAGERLLLSNVGRHRGWQAGTSLSDIASALVILCELPLPVAQGVVDDYALALSLRGVGPPPHFRRMRQQHQRKAPATPALTLPRVFPAGATLELANDTMHVRNVVLSDERCEIAVTYDQPPSWHMGGMPRAAFRRSPMPHRVPGGPGQLTIADDQGATSPAGFNGGGGDAGWEGRWVTQGPLSASTHWLDIDGHRLTLPDPAPPAEVTIEPLATGPLAHRYLWQRLALQDHGGSDEDQLLEVLLRVGVLDPDDEADVAAIGALRLVTEARSGGTKLRGAPGSVPPEWQSILGTKHRSGPTGTVAVGALTPVFDGIQCVVYDLRSESDWFTVEARVQGAGASPHPMMDDQVATTSLAWWANDDRGNSYLGHWNSHSSGPMEASGTLQFEPSLDRKATVLYLTPTSLHSRAMITVPLPEWARR
jgi:hypothetical protein